MLNRTTLDPETRVLYGDSLQPPPGYVFDAAIATTFSLDFETALAAPVSLALFAAENRDDILTHPLALLEGAERIAGRLVIYADAGHLHAQSRPHSRLCSLLERIIVEVAAPREGAFHPKLWALGSGLSAIGRRAPKIRRSCGCWCSRATLREIGLGTSRYASMAS